MFKAAIQILQILGSVSDPLEFSVSHLYGSILKSNMGSLRNNHLLPSYIANHTYSDFPSSFLTIMVISAKYAR